jgi:hypothetical protein
MVMMQSRSACTQADDAIVAVVRFAAKRRADTNPVS